MSNVTLTTLAADVNLSDEAQTALWRHLGLDPESASDLAAAAEIPQHILGEALDALFAMENFPAVVAGRISILFKNLKDHFKPAAPPPVADTPAVVAPASNTSRGQMSMVIDQADNGHFEPLGHEARAKFRQNHRALTGGDPADGRAPSAEQVAAMVTKLARGDAPYVDFGVFTPHGKRHMKMLKFEAQVFVDNQLQSKMIKGPSTFESWEESWAVFRALMISTITVTSATLDLYSRGIKQLVHQHPNHWGVIFCADEIMRSEIWTSTAEDLFDVGNLPDKMPWDLIIRLTAFGGSECTTQSGHWWTRHVLWPCQRSESAARTYLQEVEGTDLLPFP